MANRMRRCHECDFPLGSKELFCPRCGAKQRREKAQASTLTRHPARPALQHALSASHHD